MQIVTVANQKGGVGKTTTAYNLGVGLSKRGYSVLFLDLDPQTNLTYASGCVPEEKKNIYEVLKGADINKAITEIGKGLYIVAGDMHLAANTKESADLFSGKNAFYVLRNALERLKKTFDFIVIDTPPTLGTITQNAFAVSDKVVIPVCADVYALQGMAQLIGNINAQKKINERLQIAGCLITCAKERTTVHKTVTAAFEKTAADIGTKVYKAKIRNTVAVPESVLRQTNIFELSTAAKAAEDYNAFIDEFLKDLKGGKRKK